MSVGDEALREKSLWENSCVEYQLRVWNMEQKKTLSMCLWCFCDGLCSPVVVDGFVLKRMFSSQLQSSFIKTSRCYSRDNTSNIMLGKMTKQAPATKWKVLFHFRCL